MTHFPNPPEAADCGLIQEPTAPEDLLTCYLHDEKIEMDDLALALSELMCDHQETGSMKNLNEILKNLHGDPSLPTSLDEIGINVAQCTAALPSPSADVLYTFEDLAQYSSIKTINELATSWFYLSKPRALVLALTDDVIVNALAKELASYCELDDMDLDTVYQLNTVITALTQTPQAITAFKFAETNLKIQGADDPQPYSIDAIFRRVISEYANEPNAALLPFSLRQMASPTSVMFVRLDLLILESPVKLARVIPELTHQVNEAVVQLNADQIKALGTIEEDSEPGSADMSAYYATYQRGSRILETAPTPAQIAADVAKIHRRLPAHDSSKEKRRVTYRTFARSNRREPDNADRRGKSVKKRKRADIHLYIDSSGSISADQSHSSILTAAQLAESLKVNLFITFFSDVLSPTYRIETRGKTPAKLFEMIDELVRPSGGTHFHNVYNYINKDATRSAQFSIMLTDFGCSLPDGRIEHPARLYYAPISGDYQTSYNHYMESFEPSIKDSFPEIRSHLLGMVI